MKHLLHALVLTTSLAGALALTTCKANAVEPVGCDRLVDTLKGNEGSAPMTAFTNFWTSHFKIFDEVMSKNSNHVIAEVMNRDLFQMMGLNIQVKCLLHPDDSLEFVDAMVYSITYQYKFNTNGQEVFKILLKNYPYIASNQ